jgi:orotate phosphoribosyltransferase
VASGERDFDPQRFRAEERLSGESVLLLDDTWTTGSSARSASHVLLEAGASSVALVVIGRHLRPEYEPVEDSGESCGTLFRALPEAFDWETCAVHE